MKFICFLMVFLMLGCGEAIKSPLPDSLCYYKFVHVEEIYDSADAEKFLGYKYVEAKLGAEERDTLKIILKEQHMDFVVGDNGDIFIKKQSIANGFGMSAIDGFLYDRMHSK
ncbi:hypothetical protein [Chitinophaga sp. S165]|uniref:hypothetical protein n=1 Tax=Chitinophaga sp. S165 TaxID=2135462 RepID=UPI000D718251|nr:hypothetical protein [Chitinophaga sp. S165]PWV56692.1 hypothetical protein C7475_1011209 [Chitinophaga sp. S165]